MYRREFPEHPGYGDQVRRVTYRQNPSFMERLKKSMINIVIGLALVILSLCFIFWNEGRAVQTARSLTEGLSKVISLGDVTTNQIGVEDLRSTNGKLVHLIGRLDVGAPLADNEFKLEVWAVKLKRVVEMYQWVEKESKTEFQENGETRVETTYSYSMEWKSELIDSRGFESAHPNPREFPVNSKMLTASVVKVAQFTLSTSLVNQINDFSDLATDHELLDYKRLDGWYYRSYDPYRPQVGDIRVKFMTAGQAYVNGIEQRVSIVAEQATSFLVSHQVEAGGTIEMIHSGIYTASKMFEKAQFDNVLLTWAIRLGCWILLFLGFTTMTEIITVIVDWMPLVRTLVGVGVTMTNFTLATSLSLIVTATAWIFYRPFLGWSLFMLSLSPFLFNKWRLNSDRARFRTE